MYEPLRKEHWDLGRSCDQEDNRNIKVLHALRKGNAVNSNPKLVRIQIGCTSVSSQDENYGVAMYESLKDKYLIQPSLRTLPKPGHGCEGTADGVEVGRPPRLFRAYLEISGRICGPPAIDREFKTIDFLTVVDLANLPDRVRTRFF